VKQRFGLLFSSCLYFAILLLPVVVTPDDAALTPRTANTVVTGVENPALLPICAPFRRAEEGSIPLFYTYMLKTRRSFVFWFVFGFGFKLQPPVHKGVTSTIPYAFSGTLLVKIKKPR
jgi:hypothetical protein